MVIAVREVLHGKSYMSQGLSRAEIDCLRWQQKKLVMEDERLTPRKREVLQLLAERKVMKEIGGVLNMTLRTVAYHKYRIMGVLGAKNSAELVKHTVRNHMVAA
jgi:DNA-binding CsgD family transcriptional regulator